MVLAFTELTCIGGLVDINQIHKSKKTVGNDIHHKETKIKPWGKE